MAGLGFANPALQRAQLLAKLNGSTALPQDVMAVGKPAPGQPGGGPAAPSAQMPSMPAPPSPQPLPMPPIDTGELIARLGQPSAPGAPGAPVAPGTPGAPGAPGAPVDPKAPGAPGEKRDPKWYEVAGALGHIVLSIDAGLRNQPMPDPPGGDPRQQQDQEMQVQEFIMNTAARAWEAIRKAPPEQRSKILEQFREIIGRVAPEFDFQTFMEGMMDEADWADQIAPEIAVMSEDAKSMFMARVRAAGGDPAAAAATVLKDKEFMASLQDFEDKRNVPILKFKLQKVKAAMVSMNMDPATFAGMSPEDFERVNNLLPESVRLTPSELATMRRRPDLGEVIGYAPPSDAGGDEESAPSYAGGAPTLDERAGYAPPPRKPRPAPGAPGKPSEAPANDAPPSRPSAPRNGSAPSPQKPQTPQAPQKPGAPAGAPKAPAPAPVKPGQPGKPGDPGKPYYPPGWKPRTPKPRPEPAPVTKVEVVGKRKPKPETAPQEAKPPSGLGKGERRVRATKDTDIPGFGKVKKGEVIIYNDQTGEYRRG